MTRRSIPFALLVALLFGSPTNAQSLLETFEQSVTEIELDNGLTIIVVERHDAPVVSFFTYANVGSVNEPAGQTGIAHMFEHMAFKGTTSIGSEDIDAELAALDAEESAYQRYRAARLGRASETELGQLEAEFRAHIDSAKVWLEEAAFDKLVSRNGAVGLNAFTSADQTGYMYSLPSNKLELWFALESDRFLNPVLREFYTERDVVMEERRMRTESNPQGRLIEELLTLSYKAHPYGKPTVGHMSDLESISRTEAEAFFDTYYAANNLTIALVGDVDPAEAARMAEQYFGRLPQKPEAPPVVTVEPEQLGERRVVLVEQAQPLFIAAFHRPSSYDPSDASFTVLDDVLSTGRTSRMHHALVETELALFATSIPTFPGDKYPTLFLLYAAPNQGVSPDSLESAMYAVVNELVENGMTQGELDRAKTRARADFISGLASNSGVAGQIAQEHALTGDWRNLFRKLDAIDRVTIGDVQRVAAETFRSANRSVAIIRNPEHDEDL